MRREVPALLLITDPSLGDPVAATRAALAALPSGAAAAGRVAVQLRAKDRGGRALVALGRGLRAVTAERGVPLLVNGRLDVAHAVSADGVHLPEAGVTPAEARTILGPDALVGASRHDGAGVARAAAEGADYATLGPFAATPGKGPPLGPDRFAAIAREATLPVLALGGVGAREVPAARAAGAHGVAVIRAVYGDPDPGAALTALLAALDTAHTRGG
ncbi:MAG: thiamine phosphate synthase [Myxococcota bacterium]